MLDEMEGLRNFMEVAVCRQTSSVKLDQAEARRQYATARSSSPE
jgi:hypothetical protein